MIVCKNGSGKLNSKPLVSARILEMPVVPSAVAYFRAYRDHVFTKKWSYIEIARSACRSWPDPMNQEENTTSSPTADFFISYTQADCEWAEWIAAILEQSGYSTVIQALDSSPGSNFIVKMHEAAAHARRTIAVLSPDYLNSAYAASEWAAALALDPTGTQRKLIPVRVRECAPEGLLKATVFIDLVDLSRGDATKVLLNGIKTERKIPHRESDDIA